MFSRQRETPRVSCFVIFLINTSHVLAQRFCHDAGTSGDNSTFLSFFLPFLRKIPLIYGRNQFRIINAMVETRQTIVLIISYIEIYDIFRILLVKRENGTSFCDINKRRKIRKIERGRCKQGSVNRIKVPGTCDQATVPQTTCQINHTQCVQASRCDTGQLAPQFVSPPWLLA